MFGAIVLIGSESSSSFYENNSNINATIRMLGRFSNLKSLKHKHLAEYVELVRCQSGWFVVFVLKNFTLSPQRRDFNIRISNLHILTG
jgi:hypothetical protein